MEDGKLNHPLFAVTVGYVSGFEMQIQTLFHSLGGWVFAQPFGCIRNQGVPKLRNKRSFKLPIAVGNHTF